MRILQTLKTAAFSEVILLLTGVVFYCCLVQYYPFSFNYEIESHNQYAISAFAVLCFLLSIIMQIRNSMTASEIVIRGVAVLIMGALYYSVAGGFSNEHLTVLSCIFIVVFCCTPRSVRFITQLWLCLLIVYAWQLLFGLFQFGINYGGVQRGITGSLQNSGVYSCYLVIALPLVFFFSGLGQERWRKTRMTSALVVTLITLLIVLYNRSRTALVVLAVGCVYRVLVQIRGSRMSRKWKLVAYAGVSIAIMLVIAWGARYAIEIKALSASGRMLMQEVVCRYGIKHPWTGVGVGKISWYYPQWQSLYFAMEKSARADFVLSAGEAYIIQNEYLQWYTEAGLTGTIAGIAVLVWFFQTRSNQYNRLLRMLKLTMCAILVSALTTYTAHISCFLFLFFFCLLTALRIKDRSPVVTRKWKIWTVAGISTVAGIFLIVRSIDQFQKANQWASASQSLSDDAMLQTYNRLYTDFKTDGKFLIQYAEAVMQSGKNQQQAVTLIEESRKYFISYRGYVDAARIYEIMGRYKEAIDCQQFLADYIPSKFQPRYELLQLYRASGDSLQVVKTARAIIALSAKIPSARVEFIRQEAKRALASFSFTEQ